MLSARIAENALSHSMTSTTFAVVWGGKSDFWSPGVGVPMTLVLSELHSSSETVTWGGCWAWWSELTSRGRAG